MSLKKGLRTAQKVSREIDKTQKAEGRREEAIDRLEARLRKKPISTLNIRHDPVAGLASDTANIQTPAGRLTYGPATAAPTDITIQPTKHEVGGVAIEPLDLFFTNWMTVVPIRVSNTNPDFRPNVNWVKTTNRSSSSIFLLDPENSEYYYPVETSFTGDILAGHPRSGLFAFEPFRSPTSRVELHLSNIRLGPSGSREAKSTLKFVMQNDGLYNSIEVELQKPGVAGQLKEHYAQHVGCSVMMLLAGAGALAGGVRTLLLAIA